MFLNLCVGLNPLKRLDDVSPSMIELETSLPWLIIGSRLLALLMPRTRSLAFTMWTFVLGLEREMSVSESLYLHLLICMLLYFCTGFVCETRSKVKTPDEDPIVDLPPAPSWRCTQSKYRRWMNRRQNPKQYYLMQRMKSRPVQRPVRDAPPRLTQPWTWNWNRRVPTDDMRHDWNHETRRKP
jgi:hypothetical protein